MEATKKLTRKEKIAQNLPKEKGNRKARAAEARKTAQKDIVVAELKSVPTSPQKMRLLADQIRGQRVDYALGLLQLSPRHSAKPLRKLLLAAVDSWKQKKGDNVEDLIVKTIMVDGASILYRTLPAPQGRAYRIRKRSNHVTIQLDTITNTSI